MTNKLHNIWQFAGLILGIAGVAMAQTRTASLIAHGKSVQLLPSNVTTVPGVGNVTAYFTTFNGTAGVPLVTSEGIVSGELRPRTANPGLYEGGYAQATPLVVVDYGSYTVSIPTADLDSNGIPDLIQYDRNGDFTASGSGFSAPAGVTFSISVRFTRPTGAAIGSYTATTQNSTGQINVVNGVYDLLSYEGTISYSRGATNTMTITATVLLDTSTTLTGSTSYTATSADQIAYPAFTIRSSTGHSYQVRAGTLSRAENVYRSNFRLVDGLPQTAWADFTDYALAIVDPNDTDGNGIPDFSDPTAAPPIVTSQPRATSTTVGEPILLSVLATGATSYQWTKDGTDMVGATSATLNLQQAQLSDAGTYAVKVSNAAGAVTSNSVSVIITAVPTAARFDINPLSLAAATGQTVVLNAVASGSPAPTLQWQKDGFAIAGATSTSLVLSSVTSFAAGDYICVATNTSGSVTSSVARLAVSNSDSVGRIINLSILTSLDAANSSFTMGAVIGGADTSGTTPLLFRAAGPSLTQFGVNGAHSNPQIEVFAGSSKVGQNDDWGGGITTANAFAQVGAFAYPGPGSKDAAIFSPAVPSGATSIIVSGVETATGTVLAEIYEGASAASRTSSTPRLINVSVLKPVPVGAPATVGFVLGGSTATTVLVRAIGPALTQFGVTDTMSDPQLTLYQSNEIAPRAANDNWGSSSIISNVFASVGAFALSNGSTDAALLITLPPGGYSAQVTGTTSGTVLAEVYEVPPRPVPPVNLSDGLLAYYPFNGNANDESGNGNNATPAGNFLYLTTGLSGGALRIVGDNSLFYSGGGHVLLPQFGASMNSGFTLSLWTRDDVIGSDPVGQEDYVSFGILDQAQLGITLSNRSGRLWADFYMDSGLGGAAHLNAVMLSKELGDRTAAAATWKHFVMVYIPGKFAAFLDGEKLGEKAITANGFPFDRAALGRHWWSGGHASASRMSATYDNVRIYSRALADTDVQALYLTERP